MTQTETLSGNWNYYAVVGNGNWSGKFTFQINDWKNFWKEKTGFWNSLFSLIIHFNNRIFGPFKILSYLKVFPQIGPAGTITNLVIIKFWGIKIYVLKENYVLNPDGENVCVNSKERLGPIPFLFNTQKQHPAIVMNDGEIAQYLDMPILGSIWTGIYQVAENKDFIGSTLIGNWAQATETIRKNENGPGVAQVIYNQPKDIDAVIVALTGYRDWFDRQKDARATFTHAYLIITQQFRIQIPKKGFNDPVWIEDLVIAFSCEYLTAIHNYDTGNDVEDAWKFVFDTILKKRSSVFEELVLSMAAHIIQDLPLALHQTDWKNKPEGERIADFHLVNDILVAAINDIQDAVGKRYNGFLGWLDRMGKQDDEILTNYGIRLSRGMAWYNAVRLEGNHQEVRDSLVRSVRDVIKQITKPPFSLSIFFRIIRFISQLSRRWPQS